MAHNFHGNPKELTAKPKGFWFCRELFGFVVTVVVKHKPWKKLFATCLLVGA